MASRSGLFLHVVPAASAKRSRARVAPAAARPRRAAWRQGARERGSFMLEALIGILIFSFGVLGVVGLQAQSMRHMNDVQYRGEAVYLANALIASMWADDPTRLAARYQSGGAGYSAFVDRVKHLPGADLPGNAPVVKVEPGPSASSSLVTVQVYWQMPGEATANRHNYTTTAVVGLNP